jgi:hypothetical protein
MKLFKWFHVDTNECDNTEYATYNTTQELLRISARKWNYKLIDLLVVDSPNFSIILETRSSCLLGRCSRQLRKTISGVKMANSRAECMSILEYYFSCKSFAGVRDAFSSSFPDREVSNRTTIHEIVKKCLETESVYLWQTLIEQ